MNSEDLKLFALFYIRDDEFLSDKNKIKLMEFVEKSSDEEVLFLLATGQVPQEKITIMKESGGAFQFTEYIADIAPDMIQKGIEFATGSGGRDLKNIVRAGLHTGRAGFQGYKTYKTVKGPATEKPWGAVPVGLTGVSIGNLASSVAYKLSQKKLKKLQVKCDKEKGQARKVCYNKVRRDSIRSEIVSLSSMKVKCRKTKNSEQCIKKIEQRIKELQNRMDSIKLF